MIYQHHFRRFLTLLLLAVPFVLPCAEQTNSKFAMTTRLFLDEFNHTGQAAAAPGRPGVDRPATRAIGNVVATPVYENGIAYISCFIHLVDPTDLSALEALGVKDMQTYDKLTFITANVPVAQMEALAALDNVTMIKVSELMQPATDLARKQTGVQDLLTMSPAVTGRGISTRYDGTGVVLGVVDAGIDFRHIAFKDKDGNCRIRNAYIYDGTVPSGIIYVESDFDNPDSIPTTDNVTGDHGTHTASTAGGSSVIVNKIDSTNFVLTVTENHDSATYGGMAPGTEMYLGGVYNLDGSKSMVAIKSMIEYADTVGGTGKPLVISNSWGTTFGPRNGHSELAQFFGAYFGDDHPNRIILFAAGNEVGDGGTGGIFVRKTDADASHPLGTIIRTDDGESGDNYEMGYLTSAWSDSAINCTVYVLENSTGNILWNKTMNQATTVIDSICSVGAQNDTTWFYTGALAVFLANDPIYQQYCAFLYGLTDLNTTTPGAYSLALEVFPFGDSAGINMWGFGTNRFTTDNITTAGHTWINGNDDMSVSDQTAIPEVISVGAYVTRNKWYNYAGKIGTKNTTIGDIAPFSSYSFPELSPTGQKFPTITAPGSMLISAVNHYHTSQVDTNSYYVSSIRSLIVNDSLYPYGTMQGTSMATPTAAGIVALWLQAAAETGKTLTPNRVKDIMRRTASHDSYTTNISASRFGQGKLDALAGLHFIADDVLDMYDTAYNDAKILVNSDTVMNVMLCGRTLYKDNGWNTLCLPFSMSLEGSVLAGATLVELDPANSGLQGTTLTLNFTTATSIEAGKPYLIKWPEGTDITYPLFENVTLVDAPTTVTSTDGSVSFVGSYSPEWLFDNDWTALSMGANNTLYRPDEDFQLGAFRAVFRLNNSTQAPSRVVLNVNGEAVATDIAVMHESGPSFPQAKEADDRGVKFITNGQLYIRRGGIIYDSLGRKVKPLTNNR